MSAPAAPAHADRILHGIGLMVLAMALLALSDVFIKLSTRHLPPGQVMLLLSVGGTLLFVLLARAQRAPVWHRAALHPMVLLRNAFEIMGAFGLILSLTYVPLPIFAAIMQMAPLVVTIGAAVFLKEQVGPRRWVAVGAGIVGMLLVVRPGMAGFAPSALYAVVAVTALAMRDLVTRLSPPGIPAVSLSTWGFAATMPAGLVLMAIMGTPFSGNTAGVWPVIGGVLVTTTGYYALTSAMRAAPVSIVSPFRYARLVFTMGLGVLIFGERPDALTLLGAAIILVAGLYTFVREHQIARTRRAGGA